SPAPAWTSWTSPPAWHRAPCATSRPGRPRAGSPSPMPRSRSAPRPAACSGCCGCASSTPNASTRPPSTSSPRPSCACSASPHPRPPASPPSPSQTPARGNSRHDAAGRPAMFPEPAMNPSRPQLSRYGWRPVDPPRRPVLFVNPRSGDGKAARAGVAERARAKGIEAVILAPGQDLAALAREAVTAGADALGMAGGDGSLAVVAAAAAAHLIPFVCVPGGTRNHFALDVGVDRHDLAGALDAFTDGVERQIDTAEVNGRLFLNNVSLGIYGEAVRSPAYRDAKTRTLLEIAA